MKGYVNFPVDDPEWECSKEGGMLVRLVVYEPENQNWMQCSGGYQHVYYDQDLLTDDTTGRWSTPVDPEEQDPETLMRAMMEDQKNREDLEEKHFPHVNTGFEFNANLYEKRYMSRPYLCVMTMGSTGWSGTNEEGYWYCTYDDLTPEGKELYNALSKLYENCVVELVTWLDT